MKNSKLLSYLMFLLSGSLLSSCLKDQTDLFDKTASDRITGYTDNAHKVLRSAEQGWLFEVFPGKDQRYGGVVYTVKFDSLTCTVKTELAQDASQEETSHYKMTNEGGSGFIFDSYNALFHRLSEGTSEAYQAFGGDLEFILDSVGTDVIKVHGARSLSTCMLYRLTKAPADYIKEVKAVQENFLISNYKGNVNGKEATLTVDLNLRQVTISSNTEDASEEPTKVAFAYTDKGIRLYKPITANGKTFSEFVFDSEAGTLSANDAVFTGVLPKGYRKFNTYAGTYTLTFHDGKKSKEVTLAPNQDNTAYLMTGLFDNTPTTPVVLKYDKATGSLQMTTQDVGKEGGNTVKFCPWDTNEGYFTWSPQGGMNSKWNGNEDKPAYTFDDNGKWQGNKASGFLIRLFDASGKHLGAYKGTTYMINNSSQFVGPFILTKK